MWSPSSSASPKKRFSLLFMAAPLIVEFDDGEFDVSQSADESRSADEDQSADESRSADEGMEAVSDMDSEGSELNADSMTGKGLKRLCSELLELKKSSDDDFQKNICSNYSAFLRIFEEVGDIEIETVKIKEHISTQRMLVKELMNSFPAEIVLENFGNLKDECVEDLDLDFPNWWEQNILETLDILLSEHRLEEALVVLEKETEDLKKLCEKKDCLLPIISPFASAISDRRIRLAKQFASLAEHKRVTWPELYNALFGLCRLGESHHASVSLLNFFHLQLIKSVDVLKCSQPFALGTYSLELMKIALFTISQAARSFVLLFGKSSPYTADLMTWATEELEIIFGSFYTCVKSFSDTGLALGLVVETMRSSFSFCSLLESENLFLQPDMLKLMKPCIEEVLLMHIDHLKEVVSLFSVADNWVLREFHISEILSDKISLQELNGKMGCCQLTSSGRKFVRVVQMILDDVFPMHALHMESLILKGLGNLFDGYTFALEKSIKTREYSTQKLQQQISILVNSSVLVHLLPTIVSHVLLPEPATISSLEELDIWMLSIQEASDRVKHCFCQQFVSHITWRGDYDSIKGLYTCSCGHCIPGSTKGLMPSFAFQELFLWMRQLEELYESTLLVEDGIINCLQNEIMRIVLLWLSEHSRFLVNAKSHSQFLLDIYFLMEIARSGGYFSDDLMIAAHGLMNISNSELSGEELHLNSEIPEEGWASNAAKLAINILTETDVVAPETKYNPLVACIKEIAGHNHEGMLEGKDGCKVNWADVSNTPGESSVALDGKIVNLTEHSTKLIMIEGMLSQTLNNPMSDALGFSFDEVLSTSQTIPNTHIEDGEDAEGTDNSTGRLSEISSMNDLNVKERTIISEEESTRYWDLSATASQLGPSELIDMDVSVSTRTKILLGVPENLEPVGSFEHREGSVNIENFGDSNEKISAPVDGFPKGIMRDPVDSLVLQMNDMICCVEGTYDFHLTAADKTVQYDISSEKNEMLRAEAQSETHMSKVKHLEGNLADMESSSDDEGRVDTIAHARKKS